jgi:hypothetical protein
MAWVDELVYLHVGALGCAKELEDIIVVLFVDSFAFQYCWLFDCASGGLGRGLGLVLFDLFSCSHCGY